jgi:hypothetical protein
MKTSASSPEQYIDALPADRRADLSAVRDVIRKNLDADYEEGRYLSQGFERLSGAVARSCSPTARLSRAGHKKKPPDLSEGFVDEMRALSLTGSGR